MHIANLRAKPSITKKIALVLAAAFISVAVNAQEARLPNKEKKIAKRAELKSDKSVATASDSKFKVERFNAKVPMKKYVSLHVIDKVYINPKPRIRKEKN